MSKLQKGDKGAVRFGWLVKTAERDCEATPNTHPKAATPPNDMPRAVDVHWGAAVTAMTKT